jgi:hypothetical protein
MLGQDRPLLYPYPRGALMPPLAAPSQTVVAKPSASNTTLEIETENHLCYWEMEKKVVPIRVPILVIQHIEKKNFYHNVQDIFIYMYLNVQRQGIWCAYLPSVFGINPFI